MNPLLYGHRGARGHAPENTIPSFDIATKMGVDGFELDVHESRDGKLVVMHDDTVNRTTDGEGAIISMNSDKIKRLDAGIKFGDKWKGTNVPFLEEVLDAFSEFKIKIELKHSSKVYPHIEEKLLEAVKSRKMLDNIQFISFDFDAIKNISELDRRATTGILIFGKPLWFIDKARKLGSEWIQAFYGLIDGDDVELLHKGGLKIGVWTINDAADVRNMLSIGADDLTSDYPDVLVKMLKASS
ncbi:MAG: glycerophosphodiester phosphodiesterase [Nitrososphaerota archaeon]|jgi:glycerophosphoryl diester phosphodiesterase|nr:glycerophosphodiester phosphodiesterase [Nitrososphaerota archaeon]MDG7041027.1 glycerophosphodiester phosphodiesterase [Nitrososphaerota archaeon]MDG7043410.1 glycerophosphodiester phosphodiesterase [Nitrososphaerota archaeon]MDG7046401.1 glycerophosphodiester phosphodiesterase [Nitrososphaerota archaeon]MDG7048116.1 glycerophosphodiester phosphodiesterase [Nitrososphaerota archaeon]